MNKQIYRLLSGRFGAGLEIRVLMRQTAKVFGAEAPGTVKAFGAEAPGTAGLLGEYARFSAAAAGHAIESGQDLKNLRRELYLNARRMGNALRRWLRPRNERECLAILVMLYRNIGITIREVRPGEFCVYKCFFSSFYTPEVCSVISAVDQGIFAGIFNGGMLKFYQRISEGQDVCRADVKRGRIGDVSRGSETGFYSFSERRS